MFENLPFIARRIAPAAIALFAIITTTGCATWRDRVEVDPQPRSPGQVQVLTNVPERGYQEVGRVTARQITPIPGVTTRVSSPLWFATPTIPSELMLADDVDRRIDRADRAVRAGDPYSVMHHRLRVKAAALGADAVVPVQSGIDQDGRLWAEGIAYRRVSGER